MGVFKYKCGLVQLNSGPDISSNIQQASDSIDEAARLGAQLICLPECTPFLGRDKDLIINIESIERALTDLLAKKAKQHGVTIAAAGYRKSGKINKVYNCLFWCDPGTLPISIYEKTHLYDVDIPDGVHYRESDSIEPGQKKAPVLLTQNFGNIAASICYDLRFPECFREQTMAGANVILLPAAFTKYTGESHWEVLLRARAIENLGYMIAPAQTGVHIGKRESWGHSMVVDPWGNIVAQLDEKPGVLIALIDEQKIIDARNKIQSTRPE